MRTGDRVTHISDPDQQGAVLNVFPEMKCANVMWDDGRALTHAVDDLVYIEPPVAVPAEPVAVAPSVEERLAAVEADLRVLQQLVTPLLMKMPYYLTTAGLMQ